MNNTGDSVNGDIYFEQKCFTITLKFRFRLIASVPWTISGQFSVLLFRNQVSNPMQDNNKTNVPFVAGRKGLFNSNTREKMTNRWKNPQILYDKVMLKLNRSLKTYTRQYLPGIYSRTGYIKECFWKCLPFSEEWEHRRVGTQKNLNLIAVDMGLIN